MTEKSSAVVAATLPWPSREIVAREIRRAMLDNPTDDSFNKRAEKREAIADVYAGIIMDRFAAALAHLAPPAADSVREALIKLRDDCLRESKKTDTCYTCYTEQAAYIAGRIDAVLSAPAPAAPTRDEIALLIDSEAWKAIEDGRDCLLSSKWGHRRQWALNKADEIIVLFRRSQA